jgi:hypothetical protein
MMSTRQWFEPKRHTGFKKELSVQKNAQIMYRNSDKRMSRSNRWLRVGKQAQALANVTKDIQTKNKARSVAEYAFDMSRKAK